MLNYLPKFGFKNLIADWTFLRFLQYFGDEEARELSGYALSPEYFQVILSADPYYRFFYVFASGSTTLYAGLPQRSVALIEEGLTHLEPNRPSDSYFLWRYKGTDELLFLGDAAAAQQSFLMAADWAKQSDDPEAELVATVSQRMALALADNLDSRSARISAWATIFASAFDETTQQRAITEIKALGGDLVVNANGEVQVKFPVE